MARAELLHLMRHAAPLYNMTYFKALQDMPGGWLETVNASNAVSALEGLCSRPKVDLGLSESAVHAVLGHDTYTK